MFEQHHFEGLRALHLASRDPGTADAIQKALEAGINWQQIIAVLLAQLPNVLSGNWAAVIAAILALIVPQPTPPVPHP